MNIYVDESGSMTQNGSGYKDRYFIITLLLVENPERLRRVYKRFIRKYYDELKSADSGKMFKNDKFFELKGSSFTPDLKKQFVEYFCKNNMFKVLYIKVDNHKLFTKLFRDKACLFNYCLKIALTHLKTLHELYGVVNMQIDTRNVKSSCKFQLDEYLYTELVAGESVFDDICVKYYESQNNKLIQLADVFSNLFYSDIVTHGAYDSEIRDMICDGYIIKVFIFPLS